MPDAFEQWQRDNGHPVTQLVDGDEQVTHAMRLGQDRVECVCGWVSGEVPLPACAHLAVGLYARHEREAAGR